jgi:anaerobic selenocysteine-containing dehydrogenase
LSGIPEETIVRLTREFCATTGAAAYGRLGVSTTGFGTVSTWAINCLNLVGGDFDRPGGVMFPEPAVDVVARRFVGTGHFNRYRSRVRDLPEYGGELPAACMREEIETPGDGRIRAFVTIAGNPVLSTPDGRRLGDALDSLDFMAAIDIYLNETTRHADVILPPTTALERDHYDLVFHGFAVRNTARFSSAVFEKPADAMHDWEIYRELVARSCCAQGVVRRSGSCARTRRASTSGRCDRRCPSGCRRPNIASISPPRSSSTTSPGSIAGSPSGRRTHSC